MSEGMAARALADLAWEGKWHPERELNSLPCAQHTIRALYDAGYRLLAPEPTGV